MRLRRLLLTVLFLVLGGGAVVWGVGSTLPQEHQASRSVELPLSVELVWGLISDPVGSSAWRPEASVVSVADHRGHPAFTETTKMGEIQYAFETIQAPHKLVMRILDNKDFGGTWTYELRPSGSGSSLRITEDGEVYNPLFRFMSRYVFGYDAALKDYLQDLEARCKNG